MTGVCAECCLTTRAMCVQCLLCPGCRESIEENEDFTMIKKKAFHADCARDVRHCRVCDKVRPDTSSREDRD